MATTRGVSKNFSTNRSKAIDSPQVFIGSVELGSVVERLAGT